VSFRTRTLALAITPVIAVLAACGGGSASSSGDEQTVRLGVTGAADPHWALFTQKAAAQGIKVKLTDFTDYQLPNQALAQGDIDSNEFQHLAFLAQFNSDHGTDLEPVGATIVVPLSLYSKKHTSVAQFPQGAKIAVPNDSSNEGRALRVLEEAVLFKLNPAAGLSPTPKDITENPKNVQIVPVDAAQTVVSLPDVDGAVINDDYLANAGLKQSDAIFADDPKSDAAKPYINVFAVNAKDIDKPVWAKLVAIYHDPEVEKAVVTDSGGGAVVVNTPVAELRTELADLEKGLK
jgi:D-methionine transport system substrate-binding protein